MDLSKNRVMNLYKFCFVVFMSLGFLGSSQSVIGNLKNDIYSPLKMGIYEFAIAEGRPIKTTADEERDEQEESIKSMIEYDRVPLYYKLNVLKGYELKNTGKTIKLKINVNDSLMTISPAMTSTDFPSFSINLKTNKLEINDVKLDFLSKSMVNDPDNLYKSRWWGYKWRTKEKTQSKNHSESRQLQYTITFGQLIETRQILLALKTDYFYKGNKVNMEFIRLLSNI